MKKILSVLLLLSNAVMASVDPVKDLMTEHLKKYATMEHISAIIVATKVNDKITNYAVGHRTTKAESPAATPDDLFDIGSITKSYTAALALLAESEQKIDLAAPLSDYLKEYPRWGDLTLTGLLNMSTGIPNYSNSPKMNYLISQNIKQFWATKSLIDLTYPKDNAPPLQSGYFYSNTGYALMEIILVAKYQKPFKQLLMEKILKPLNLMNTFYPIPDYSAKESKRMLHGYAYNVYDNPELLGQDVTACNLSWAGAAGGIIATAEDIIHWVDELFNKNELLTGAQQEQMQQLISLSDGRPLKKVGAENLNGFALGIAAGYAKEIGDYWFYEGQTLGYRALYMYVPCNKVIVVAIFNSATNGDNDHSGPFIQSVYAQLMKLNPKLMCKQKPDESVGVG